MNRLVLLCIVALSVSAKEEVPKQKRGLLSQDLQLQDAHSQGGYQYAQPQAVSHVQYSQQIGPAVIQQAHSHNHIDVLGGQQFHGGHGQVDVQSSGGYAQLSGLGSSASGYNNVEINAAQEHIQSAQLNNFAGNGYGGSNELAAAQGHLSNAQLGGGGGVIGAQQVQHVQQVQQVQQVHEVRVPVEVNQIVKVDRPVPYPVQVDRPVPVQVRVNVDRPVPVKVIHQRPYNVEIPIEVPRPVPVVSYRHVKVPQPYTVHVPINHEKHIHIQPQTISHHGGHGNGLGGNGFSGNGLGGAVLLVNGGGYGSGYGGGYGSGYGSGYGAGNGGLGGGLKGWLGGLGGGQQQPQTIVKHIDLTQSLNNNHGHHHSHGWSGPVHSSW